MRHVQIDTTHVAYAGCETGDPLLLLHCTGGSASHWNNIAELMGMRFHLIAPDLCGYGETGPWPGIRPFMLADEVLLLAPILDTLARPMHVVGHSYGGAVALQLARRYPERVASLTVIEPAAFHLLVGGDDGDELAFDEICKISTAICDAVICGDYVRGMRRFVDYWGGEGTWAALPDDKRTALIARIGKVALDFWAALKEPTRLDDFAALKIPTLVLRGSRSPSPTHRICWRLAQRLPDTELQTIDGAGHMLPLTHASLVQQSIVRHIDRCSADAKSPPSPTPGQRWCDSIERELNNRLMGRGNWFGACC
jgi:pimeloyl-ACP methyl ester carboxylesterase